jgi:hypothetical protein
MEMRDTVLSAKDLNFPIAVMMKAGHIDEV